MSSLLTRLKAKWPKGSFVRNAGVLAGSTALAQAVALLASPLITRIYTPEDFGVLGVYASFLSILAVIATMRYELAIPLAKNDETAVNAAVLSIVLAACISVLAGLLIFLTGDSLFIALNAEQLMPYSWLIPVGVFLLGIYQTLNYWAVRTKSFTRIARTKLSQSFSSIAAQVGLGLAATGPLGLLFGHIIGQTAGAAVLAKNLPRSALSNVTPKSLATVLRRYRDFPLFAGPGALLNTASSQMPVIIFAVLYGPAVAGLFALTQRIISLPLQLIGNSVNQVFFSEVANLIKTNPAGLRPRFLRITSSLLLMSLVPAILLLAFGPQLFSIVFGLEWHQAGQFSRILSPMLILQFAISPIAHLNLLERQGLNLIWNIARALLVAAALLISFVYDLPVGKAIGAYAIAMSIAYLLMAGLWLMAARALAESGASSE